MIRRLLTLIVVSLGVLAVPAAANACQAEAGIVSVSPPNVSTYGYLSCANGTSYHYQLRLYVQSNYGGSYHIVGPGATWDIYSPPAGNQRRNMSTSCTYYEAAATATRAKAVVENMDTGSIDIDYGGVSSLPSSCQ